MSYMKRYLEILAEERADRDAISYDDAMDKILEEANDDGYSFEEDEDKRGLD